MMPDPAPGAPSTTATDSPFADMPFADPNSPGLVQHMTPASPDMCRRFGLPYMMESGAERMGSYLRVAPADGTEPSGYTYGEIKMAPPESEADQPSKDNFPVVLPDDYGIRPAGPPDECFYCRKKVGEPHGPDCVCIVRTVRLRFDIEADVQVPYGWSASNILYYYGQSRGISDLLRMLQGICSKRDNQPQLYHGAIDAGCAIVGEELEPEPMRAGDSDGC